MVKELRIISKDKVGLLADISYVLGMEKINIERIDVQVLGDMAVIDIAVAAPRYDQAKRAIEKNKYEVLATDAMVVKLEDKPGALAEMSRQLAEKGINITHIHVIGKQGVHVFDSITVDKPEEARKLLADRIANEF